MYYYIYYCKYIYIYYSYIYTIIYILLYIIVHIIIYICYYIYYYIYNYILYIYILLLYIYIFPSLCPICLKLWSVEAFHHSAQSSPWPLGRPQSRHPGSRAACLGAYGPFLDSPRWSLRRWHSGALRHPCHDRWKHHQNPQRPKRPSRSSSQR